MKRYTLTDPTTNEIKYEGEMDDIDGWYDKHKNDDWVKRLRKIYKKPIMHIIGDIVKVIPPPIDTVQLEGGDIVKKNGDIVKVISPPVEDIVKKNNKDGDIVKRNHTEEHRIKLSNALGHKVIINGVEYRSKLHAKKELKVAYNTVIKLMNK